MTRPNACEVWRCSVCGAWALGDPGKGPVGHDHTPPGAWERVGRIVPAPVPEPAR